MFIGGRSVTHLQALMRKSLKSHLQIEEDGIYNPARHDDACCE